MPLLQQRQQQRAKIEESPPLLLEKCPIFSLETWIEPSPLWESPGRTAMYAYGTNNSAKMRLQMMLAVGSKPRVWLVLHVLGYKGARSGGYNDQKNEQAGRDSFSNLTT